MAKKYKTEKDWEDWGEEFGRRMERKFKRFDRQNHIGIGFPLVLIVIGVYYLGMSLSWFVEIPFWPILIIVIGVYLLLKNLFIRR